MPQYQPPVEPLIWIVNPLSLNIDEKILAVLKILRELRMTAMDLMLHSISNRAPMLPWREARLRETTPWLRRILLSAMQTVRAAKENKKQNIETLKVQHVLQKVMI
ncbi:hypothetical protein BD769DRAFT_1398213 [Suillus cothurnatus]|nr:hypothetical protein BD769DRAFT_1398213 [Suillus cothurnatus]